MVVKVKIIGSDQVEDGYVQYTIGIEDGSFEWIIRKRYNDFRTLHSQLVNLPARVHLPPRGLIGMRSRLQYAAFLARRQIGLEAYLNTQLGQIDDLDMERTERYQSEIEALTLFLAPNRAEERTRKNTVWVSTARPEAVRIIRPHDEDELEVGVADTIGLLGYEEFMGNLDSSHSGIFGVAFKLAALDDDGLDRLEESLRGTITAIPYLAGRVRNHSIALCNAGIPFTVVQRSETCPEDISHTDIKELCDFRTSKHVMSGSEPLLTVKVNKFSDGIVVGITASHCVMDGSSLFCFLKAWGCVSRGQPHGLRENVSRARLRQLLKRRTFNLDESGGITSQLSSGVDNLLHQIDDTVPEIVKTIETSICKSAAFVALKAVTAIVPRLLGDGAERVRLTIPKNKLNPLKNAATPPLDAGGDGWVSTQEAVVAHLLRCLWRVFMGDKNLRNNGCAKVSFFVDVRRYLDLPDNFSFGTGFQVVDMHIARMHDLELHQIAGEIHENSKGFGESAASKWALWHGAFEDRVRLEPFIRDAATGPKSDLSLTVNNNSKRDAPDFGIEAGGAASGFMASMGPTLLLTSRHGMEVILDQDNFAAATPEKKQEFMKAFMDLP